MNLHDYGFLDTNVFVHPLYENDPDRARCRQVLDDLSEGRAIGFLNHIIVHELTYVLKAKVESMKSRQDIRDFITPFLLLDNIEVPDRELLVAALVDWADNSSLGFADVLLKQYALQSGRPVCSVNRKDFDGVTNSL